MSGVDPQSVALRFNELINARDLDGLVACMSEHYTFIDALDSVETGKQHGIASWRAFFEQFPDYRNVFERVLSRGNLVVMAGYSTCSFGPLDGPALWTARVSAEKVEEWRVYDDTPQNRQLLGLSG